MATMTAKMLGDYIHHVIAIHSGPADDPKLTVGTLASVDSDGDTVKLTFDQWPDRTLTVPADQPVLSHGMDWHYMVDGKAS